MPILTVSTDLLLFILGAGVLQAFLLAGLLLFHRRSDRSSNPFLALYILCISIPMAMSLLQYLFSWQAMLLIDPFAFMIGPTLYLYVRSFRRKITFARAWPHFIVSVIGMVVDYRLYSYTTANYPLENEIPPALLSTPVPFTIMTVRIIQHIVYYTLSLREHAKYQETINHMFSETSRISRDWVKWLVNGFIFLVIVLITGYALVLKYPQSVNIMILINTAMITPYIYMATIKGITQPDIWQFRRGMERVEKEGLLAKSTEQQFTTDANKFSPQKENKLDSRTVETSKRLIALLENDKLYQESELTLQDIADKMGIPSYQVSQIINDGLKKNFYDLINGYRVEEAKRLLMDPRSRNYTILAVGFEAGFNSKTTFNTVFKKFTGKTPTEYRDLKREVVTQ